MLLPLTKGLNVIVILLLQFSLANSRPADQDGFSDLQKWLMSVFYGPEDVPKSRGPETIPSYADTCECGVSQRVSKRVVGGEKSEIDKYPWLAGIQFYGMEYCLASLISDRHLITAAHCLKRVPNVRDLSLRMGSTRRAQRSTIVKVQYIHRHPNYKPTNTLADIAVLELEDPLELSQTLHPICLPPEDLTLDGAGTVAGWGAKKEGGFPSRELMEVELPIVNTTKCREVFADVHDVYETNICAGAVEGRDACQGDSGGPLMYNHNHVYYAIGLVSWGIGCGRKDLPGVYTRIQSYTDWLRNITTSGVTCRIPSNATTLL